MMVALAIIVRGEELLHVVPVMGREELMTNYDVYFTKRAYHAIINDALYYTNVETGGVLLGHRCNKKSYVIEAVTGDIKGTHSYNSFIYDKEYIERKANRKAMSYVDSLVLLGVWHKHPANDYEYSKEDWDMHTKFQGVCRTDILSGILCETGKEQYEMKLFRISCKERSECKYLVEDKCVPSSMMRRIY